MYTCTPVSWPSGRCQACPRRVHAARLADPPRPRPSAARSGEAPRRGPRVHSISEAASTQRARRSRPGRRPKLRPSRPRPRPEGPPRRRPRPPADPPLCQPEGPPRQAKATPTPRPARAAPRESPPTPGRGSLEEVPPQGLARVRRQEEGGPSPGGRKCERPAAGCGARGARRGRSPEAAGRGGASALPSAY